jgi:hypothetical protein
MIVTVLAAWGFATSRRLFQGGIIVAGVGAGILGLGAAWVLAGGDKLTRRLTMWALVGASLLLAGLIVMLLTVHFGVSPFGQRGAE